jgi:phosphate:Na+ symporter
MSIFNVLSMIGGLALFLYGMHVMGEGLAKASGGRMEAALEKMTGSPIRGVLLGAGVTAVIQSSSATTVMVVGFVNSGIMKLTQAVGVIMGANIGTTITAWILSLSGIESSNVFVSMLKPSSFSPILAIIGVIFVMFSKKEKKQQIGMILVGFAVLMFGMETMTDAVAPLKDVPEFTSLLLKFQNPLLGMLAGLILTAIIQSSSASVGILQSLCSTGGVTFGAAFPIIMGQNIGTCVTAIISAIGASKNAKRTAAVHLYFNIIGTAIFMVVFYLLNAIVHFDFINDTIGVAGIAVMHSTFNIVTTLILLPFNKVLVRLAEATIREDEVEQMQNEEKQETSKILDLLDERFLSNPALAIDNCRQVALKMVDICQNSVFLAMDQIREYDDLKAAKVLELENTADRFEDELGTYLIKVSSRDLSERDSRYLSMLLHSINDLERMSDHAVNIVEKAQSMHEKNLEFSAQAKEEMRIYGDALREIVDISVQAIKTESTDLARKVEPLEETIDRLSDEIKLRHIERLKKDECSLDIGFILSDLVVNYERVADHCSNLAVDLLRINENSFDVHEYLDELKSHEDEQFQKLYHEDRRKYALPVC